MLKLMLTAALAVAAWCVNAQIVVRGYVSDAGRTSLPGATVQVVPAGKIATTDETGFFQLETTTNETEVEIRFVGFKSQVVKINAGTINRIVMEEDVVLTDEVIVEATRAGEGSAVTFTNVSKLQLLKQNFGQDLPILLNWTPSLVTTSDAGAGVGYTGVRIRGSDATRINVTINGIPYNDSESQGTFWVDVPDVAASTQSIQVQRGVGTSTNGAGAFGASINLQTNSRNDKPYADVVNSFGSFNTRRHSVGFGSGLMNDRFVFDGRFSVIHSNGYIDRASSDLKSYYLSGGYYGEKTILKALVFGGKEITYQSWFGVPQSRLQNNVDAMNVTAGNEGWNNEQLDNLLTSNSRTFNTYTYPNQVDDYNQDHYQLHFSHRFNNALTANAAIHYTYGRGYYEEFRHDDDLDRYGLGDVTIGTETFSSSDIIRRRWLDNDFYGTTWSINYENSGLNVVFGGGWNQYDGDHFGEIMWSALQLDIPHGYRYYFNNGLKTDFNTFLKTTYAFSERLTGFVDLQYRGIGYRTTGRENRQFDFDINRNWNFFNPKAGLSYQVNNEHQLYASFAVANREPVRNDLVDALNGVAPDHETLQNLEAGWRFRKAGVSFTANYYLMNYRNQLVLSGAINDVGATIRTNVDKSYRTGVELEGLARVSDRVTIGANLTVSKNKVINYDEVLYDYGVNFDEYNVVTNSYQLTDISFSPNLIGGSIVSFTLWKGAELAWLSKYVGKQFLDNTSNNNRVIDPYWVNDLRLIYTVYPEKMREISFSLLLNNVLDEAYESNGYTYGFLAGPDTYRENYYFPQAGFNLSGMIALRF
jgi:iron complex outermembrane receptor protein